LNELVAQFEGILRRKLDVVYIEATENDPKQRKPIIEKAQRLLGWSPVVGLTQGLEKTMNYFGLHYE
jgi:nucleoside-diphosphate-sugar epimerase